MKTTKTIYIFFFCFGVMLIQAQVQDVFPTSGAIWNVQPYGGAEIYYGLTGDTIINDTTYNKLYLLNDTTLNIDKDDIYVGGIRQKDQKVWFRLNVQNHLASLSYLNSHWHQNEGSFETLLYDFSKNKGDTIWQDCILGGSYIEVYKQITASIIHEVTETDNQKTYYVEQNYNEGSGSLFPFIPFMNGRDTWVKGIGSLKGLFWFLYSAPMSGGTAYRLNCFKQGNEVKYIDKDCASCFNNPIVDIHDNKSSSISVLLHENQLSVQGDASVFPCQIKLYNVLGQLHLSEIIYSDSKAIHLPKEAGDVYLFQLINKKDESILRTGKLINY